MQSGEKRRRHHNQMGNVGIDLTKDGNRRVKPLQDGSPVEVAAVVPHWLKPGLEPSRAANPAAWKGLRRSWNGGGHFRTRRRASLLVTSTRAPPRSLRGMEAGRGWTKQERPRAEQEEEEGEASTSGGGGGKDATAEPGDNGGEASEWSFIDYDMETVSLHDLPTGLIACNVPLAAFYPDGPCRVGELTGGGERRRAAGGRLLALSLGYRSV